MNEPVEEVRDFLRTRLIDPVPGVFPYVFSTTFGDGTYDRDITEWIFTFFPRFDLTVNSFPLISVTQINETGDVFGLGSTTHWQSYQFQIDVYVKEDYVLTMNDVPREGKEVLLYLARQIQEAFRKWWISDFAQEGKFKLYRMSGKKPIAYDFEKKLWKLTITIELEHNIQDDWI